MMDRPNDDAERHFRTQTFLRNPRRSTGTPQPEDEAIQIVSDSQVGSRRRSRPSTSRGVTRTPGPERRTPPAVVPSIFRHSSQS